MGASAAKKIKLLLVKFCLAPSSSDFAKVGVSPLVAAKSHDNNALAVVRGVLRMPSLN